LSLEASDATRYLETAAASTSSFSRFLEAAEKAAAADGNVSVVAHLKLLMRGADAQKADWAFASEVLWAYTKARYGSQIIADLQTMIGFRTFATPGVENWDAPEFRRQREFLQSRAAEKGLAFRSVDGRVDEITLAGPAPVFALLTHGDVQGVEGQKWSVSPWEGKIVDGKMIGRGTEDDKGPLVAALYVLAALKDSGWPLNSTVRLLIANGEESSWDEIPYYQQRAKMPDTTIGLDAAYPVTNAQKAFGVLDFTAQSPLQTRTSGDWQIVEISGGDGLSIVPEYGQAMLSGTRGASTLQEAANVWLRDHPAARIRISPEGNKMKVEGFGKSGHSSEPESAHNALADLVCFLSGLSLQENAWSDLVRFSAAVIGQELYGKSLGIAHTDAIMGPLTVNLAVFDRSEQGQPAVHVNIRVPQGMSEQQIAETVAQKAAQFTQKTGGKIAAQTKVYGPAHIVPADSPLVKALLEVWKTETGTAGSPISMGGGSQARLFPDGVDFGPAMSMQHYRGHGADEYLTVDEMMRITRLTLAAVLRLTLRNQATGR
jgi:dipeptidase D